MTDLSLVASRLSRAADRLEQMAKDAAPGPWTVSDANEGSEYGPLWMVTNDAFHNPPADEDAPWLAVEVRTGSRAEADLIAAFDPPAVAALVPVFHAALGVIKDGETVRLYPTELALLDRLNTFAALLLGEEETGG